MDSHSKKILSFLRKNSNLDLEIPDISFHLKMDEHLVQNFLNTLYQQELITARQNERGRVYWYALDEKPLPLPKPPIPKAMAVSAPLPVSTPTIIDDDDKFDALAEGSGFPFMKMVAVLFLIAALGGGIYFGRKYFDKKLNTVTTSVTRDMVPIKDYQPFKDDATAKIGKLEEEIKTLSTSFDSLKAVFATFDSLKNEPPPEKKVVKKAVRRR